ncbi:hypothetical protein Pmar_PMAR006137 [Perkinsus marinus ATCC 50983]|uniref:Uncharacterized protein n=1 Tax=Perkinsus marinus (strain ATCC 50983 / TXsc) TaxID=423536 RepID=C5LAB3_PERM5|nr:hypothetical protein Pmar_PMAR006137 [Perkinsus marinus ATCC 50983]EER06369.1 hypothetical protein Pmar_PMAR006137 [Perkinsus marinus ATCC 50983]|eukprot:XP_002774553.1 hypothetical protein Pmar_PMAR006137 [Perkinsus marinus ATCC 50983]
MVDAIMELTAIKGDYAQAIPTSSEDTALAAFGSYLESICMIGSRSKEEIVDNVETVVWPLGKKVYDQCNTYKAPLPISVMMVKSLRKVEKSTFEVPSTSNLAGVMMALDAFARRYVKN